MQVPEESLGKLKGVAERVPVSPEIPMPKSASGSRQSAQFVKAEGVKHHTAEDLRLRQSFSRSSESLFVGHFFSFRIHHKKKVRTEH